MDTSGRVCLGRWGLGLPSHWVCDGSWPLCSLAPSSEQSPRLQKKLHQGPGREAAWAHSVLSVCCAGLCVTRVCMVCVSVFCVSRAGLPLSNSGPLSSSWKLVPGQHQLILVPQQCSKGVRGRGGGVCVQGRGGGWGMGSMVATPASLPVGAGFHLLGGGLLALTWAGTGFLRPSSFPHMQRAGPDISEHVLSLETPLLGTACSRVSDSPSAPPGPLSCGEGALSVAEWPQVAAASLSLRIGW